APQGPFALPPGTVAPVPLVPASAVEGQHERPGSGGYDDAEEAARNNSGAFEAVYPPRSRRGRPSRDAHESNESSAGPSGSHRGVSQTHTPDHGDNGEPSPPTALPQRPTPASAPAEAPAAASGRANGTATPQGAQARRRLSIPPTPIPAQSRATDAQGRATDAQGRTTDAQGRSTSVRDRPGAGRAVPDDMPTELLPPIPAAPDQAIPLQGRRGGFPALPP
ncbi:hypothetical protein, partial [Streptomyces sp. SID3343]|uniref:hypothetical protein n=1 Tax=Streptomyces sp. SID3343 TaxID=2690260 RepID=UPI0013C15C34